MINFKLLAAPFPPDRVSWRIGSVAKNPPFDQEKGGKAQALAYIDARDVMARLDEACGPENWCDSYPHLGTTTVCTIGIRVAGGEWVYRSDGAGATDVEAEKGQLSDAFKRCAVKWGIGRYLYDMPAPWVAIDKWKHIVPHELARLTSMLPKSAAGIMAPGSSEAQAEVLKQKLANASPMSGPFPSGNSPVPPPGAESQSTVIPPEVIEIWNEMGTKKEDRASKISELFFDFSEKFGPDAATAFHKNVLAKYKIKGAIELNPSQSRELAHELWKRVTDKVPFGQDWQPKTA